MKRALALGALALCGLVGLAAAASPAAADDCASLVQTIGDLANEFKVQDCLRTGDNYGRTIGLVIGGAGVVIAAGGLVKPNRPPKQPPPPNQTGSTAHPCAPMLMHTARLNQLLAARKQLEADAVREWKEHAAGAKVLIHAFTDLKAIETRIRMAIFLVPIYNFAWWGQIAAGVGAMLKAAGPAFMAAWRARSLSVAMPAVTVTAGQVLGGAMKTTAAVSMKISEQTIKDRKPKLGSGRTMANPEPTSDFMGNNVRDSLIQAMAPVYAQYQDLARKYNLDFAQWGVNMQQDLDRLNEEIQSEATKWRQAAENCPGDNKFLDKWSELTRVELPILHVPEGLDDLPREPMPDMPPF